LRPHIALLAPGLAALPDDIQRRVARLRQALGSAIELSRRIAEELHPTLLDNVGLFALGGVVNVAQPADGGILVEVSTPIANVMAPAPTRSAFKDEE
jgi:signal transduction histidine kinase